MNCFEKLSMAIGLIVVVMAGGCAKTEKPSEPTTILNFNVNDTYDTENSNDWVIVNDEEGNLLDYKPFEQGDHLTLVAASDKVGATVGVTVVKDQHYLTGDEAFWVTSRLNYPVGSEATLSPPAEQPADTGSKTGDFKVAVTDVPNAGLYQQGFMSNKGGTFYNEPSKSSGTWTFEGSTYENGSRYLMEIGDLSGNMKHTWLDLEPGGTYSISFNDFLDFDRTVDFEFPSANTIFLLIRGFEEPPALDHSGYTLYFGLPTPGTSVHAGYLSDLPYDFTSLDISYDGYWLVFESYDGIPENNSQWPLRSNFEITDKSIASFTSSASEPFVLRVSDWNYKDPSGTQVEWKVYSNSTDQIFQELPDEILTAHPLLALSNLNHSYTIFYSSYESADEFMETAPDKAIGIEFTY